MNIQLLRKKIALGLVTGLLVTSLSACAYTQEEEDAKQAGIDLMGQGSYAEAIESFDTALSLARGMVDEEEIDICYYKAAAQYLAGQPQDAITTYTNLIQFDPDNIDAYYLRGTMYLNLGDTTSAVEDFDQAVSMDTSDYERYLRIFMSLTAAGEEDEAARFLDQLLQADSTSKEAYSAKGQAMEIRGDYPSSISNYEKALKKGDTSAYIDLARVASKAGDAEAAEKYLASYEKEASLDSESYNIIGELALQQARYEDALEAFQTGLSLEKVTNRQQLRRNEIIALEYTADFASAKEKAASYVQDYPTDQEMLTEYQFLATR